ncbi:MAG TPA: gamma-glutamylcyclotransferase [Sphingomicrobium sp.]|nr:gamma-glutamylcyclotransferase [Sphingomicrobium sp.]
MSDRHSNSDQPTPDLGLDHRLAVYGSLRPGEANDHVLAPLAGTWCEGSVRGTLHTIGWGYALGHRAIRLDAAAPEVPVKLFSSADLPGFWSELDAFEGQDYQRVATDVRVGDGIVEAFIYQYRDGA